jgi:predicted RNase H-like nuclease (RuvC/YqgF family)
MKRLTRHQIQGRKEKAVRFLETVLGDPERAQQVRDESIEEYAERRKFEIANPRSKRMAKRRKTAPELEAEIDDLKDQVSELEEENEALAGQLDEIQEILEPEEEEEEEDQDQD